MLNVRQHYPSHRTPGHSFVYENTKSAPDVLAETVRCGLITKNRRVSALVGVLDNPLA
jgi:hypothetical protein